MNDRMIPYSTILRRLVIAEVLLCGVLYTIGYMGEPFLPKALGDYVAKKMAAEWTWTPFEVFLTVIDLLVVVLGFFAWFALWQDWKKARILYTLSWSLSVPTLVMYPPLITSGLTQFLEALACTISGLIFGLLYFSDLRHHYSSKHGWKCGDEFSGRAEG